jgi:hypothetical protein
MQSVVAQSENILINLPILGLQIDHYPLKHPHLLLHIGKVLLYGTTLLEYFPLLFIGEDKREKGIVADSQQRTQHKPLEPLFDVKKEIVPALFKIEIVLIEIYPSAHGYFLDLTGLTIALYSSGVISKLK